MNFFHTQNASRPYKSGGYDFSFEPYVFFGGNWRGALAVGREEEIAALRELVEISNGGITEIDQAAYESKTKKKVSETPSVPASPPSVPIHKASIKSPAEVVEDPQLSNPVMMPTGTAKSIDEILMEGTVIPSQPPPVRFTPPAQIALPRKRGRPKKSTSV